MSSGPCPGLGLVLGLFLGLGHGRAPWLLTYELRGATNAATGVASVASARNCLIVMF